MRRRGFLRNSALTGAGLVLPGRLVGQDEGRETATVSIFHTTDLHGNIAPTRNYQGDEDLGGLARCAAQIRAWRKENPDSLVVDVGDVYQGTPLGWQTRGRLMIDLFNKIGYDAWVLGNHEFDWGPEVVLDALGRSKMPVLTANMNLEGKRAGTWDDAGHPYARILPHLVKEVGGFRIGLVGMVTPGLPYWLRPELLKGFEVLAPLEILKESVTFLREEAKVDAVVACGHMGLRERDDFANPTRGLLEDVAGIDAFLGGHSHRNIAAQDHNGVLYTQADYFGIHCGKLDLVFDRESRKLVTKRAVTALMDSRIEADPVVLEVSAQAREEADTYLETEVGELLGSISHLSGAQGQASPLQHLISASLEAAARKDGIEPDGVFHGTFGSGTMQPGKKTIGDLWEVLPYENKVVALYLTREELVAVMNESLRAGGDRALYGFEVEIEHAEAGKGREDGDPFVRSLRSIRTPDAAVGHRFCILVNSYDAQSGGKRLMRLRALAKRGDSKPVVLTLSSREALIDFFVEQQTVRASGLKPES